MTFIEFVYKYTLHSDARVIQVAEVALHSSQGYHAYEGCEKAIFKKI
jgi:hypothetical protein